VAHCREEPFELDGVLDGSWGSRAIEVKTGPFGADDLRGLLELTRRFPRYRPLVVCAPAGLPAAERLGVPTVTWSQFLLDGPQGASRSASA
jgi:hypothetical protein